MSGGANRRSGGRGARRAETFGVRRWLQVGAASAGVSAALFGLSPQVGIAAADTTGESSSSSDSSGADAGGAGGSAAESRAPDTAEETATDASKVAEKDAEASDAKDDQDTDAKDSKAGDPEVRSSTQSVVVRRSDRPDDLPAATKSVSPPKATAKGSSDGTEDGPAASAPVVTQSKSAPAQPNPVSTPVQASSAAVAPVEVKRVVATNPIAVLTSWVQSWVGSWPTPTAFKDMVAGAMWTARRSLFNQAPVVAPVQSTGQLTGPITGSIGAVDPEGDRIVYRLLTGPKEGTVLLNADGTFTYTPNVKFDGVDTFVVSANDAGYHFNLFNPFRPAGTKATMLINQGAITFAFNYTTGSEYWSSEARSALQSVSNTVAAYFQVPVPVRLTYDVTGQSSTDTGILAAAGSDFSRTGVGYIPTVAQKKLISGVDANGALADGRIIWNFGYDWAYGDSVGADEYDFTSIALHELMHSFGFISYTEAPGSNPYRSWTVFDSFLVTGNRTKVIKRDYAWNTTYDGYLVGQNGGLYFGGANAVAAYGALVPLFTPNPWEPGSAMSHLDDYTFVGSDTKIMNAKAETGLRVRVLSPIEIGILKDLGYRVNTPPASASALTVIGVLFLRRSRKKSTPATS